MHSHSALSCQLAKDLLLNLATVMKFMIMIGQVS